MRGTINSIFLLMFFIVGVLVLMPQAMWVSDGIAVSTASNDQVNCQVTSDGSGGAIITWQDFRSGSIWDIYAQRIDAIGNVQWTADGVAICTAANDQDEPQITSDGSGGAIITWQDFRSGSNLDIYAQRIDASGNVQWTTDGIAICAAANDQVYPQITGDGSGGAIITWEDHRSGIPSDIYAQRVDASGNIQWTAGGVAICTATDLQDNPQITSDGSGGAIITWMDFRGAIAWDIYAQRINASGNTQWTTNGAAICTAANEQDFPQITSDGSGGAIITWHDSRSGSNQDIYAQRIDALGSVQWTTNGAAICTATNTQVQPQITSDGSGGAIITWVDNRSGSNYDIYTQRIDALGSVQWTTDGVAICTAADFQGDLQVTSDGSGGAIITWMDFRSGSYYDIYVQSINALGSVQWTTDGVAICTAANHQYFPQITSGGLGGAVITWEDNRSGSSYDIYAQSVDSWGRTGYLLPFIYAVRDVPGDQGGKVYLSWYASALDKLQAPEMSYYSIWRAISPTQESAALSSGALLLEDPAGLEPSRAGKIIRKQELSGTTYFWELMDTMSAYYLDAYGKTVATLFDSTSVSTEYHYFQVIAHTTTPTIFFVSDPDSGYSVDNLAPAAPSPLMGNQVVTPPGLTLEWNQNPEDDLSHYAIYRGSSETFVPGPGNLVTELTDTTYFDGDWRWDSGYYYKVSAVDIHENESAFSLLRPEDVTGSGGPGRFAGNYLRQNYPNPFNPSTTIRFGLKESGSVSLKIYDARGALVRVLVDGWRRAGAQEEFWDGRDNKGSVAASGVYFVRLKAGAFSEARKMVLEK